ncbi:MAG: transposase [Desulfuromonadaceae bacterium]|nr:transposase [Desulfuromonadaceae bacterium]
MRYRRSRVCGGCYFFTVVTHQRQRLFAVPENVDVLRTAFRTVIARYPFVVDAVVLLPDHLHCLWTLPEGDAGFSTRWRLIKTEFTRHCRPELRVPVSASRLNKKEQGIWQRRFWEHQIRDDEDFRHHLDYIHFNPVKHGLVEDAALWPYSSMRRYLRSGVYPDGWGRSE